MNENAPTTQSIVQESDAADLGQTLKRIPEAERVALLYAAKILAALATTTETRRVAS